MLEIFWIFFRVYTYSATVRTKQPPSERGGGKGCWVRIPDSASAMNCRICVAAAPIEIMTINFLLFQTPPVEWWSPCQHHHPAPAAVHPHCSPLAEQSSLYVSKRNPTVIQAQDLPIPVRYIVRYGTYLELVCKLFFLSLQLRHTKKL